MQINITLDGTESGKQLTAIMALCASLGERLPEFSAMFGITAAVRNYDSARANVAQVVASAPVAAPLTPTDDSDEPSDSSADPSERDAAGLPWDERIHASSRTRNADGSWRQRRGVAAELVTAVTAELSGAHPTPPAPPAPSDGPEAPAPTAPEPPVAPAAEPAAPPPPPVTAASQDDPNNPHAPFQALMKRVGAAGLVYTDLNDIAQQAGFSGYPDVAKGGAQAVATFTMMAEALGKLPPAEG